MPDGVDQDKYNKIEHIGGKAGKKEGDGKNETPNWGGAFDSLHLGANPKEECWPKNNHDKWSAVTDQEEEARGKYGDDAGDNGGIIFKPTVQKQDNKESEKATHDDAWDADGVAGDAEKFEDNLLQEMIRKIDKIAAKN